MRLDQFRHCMVNCNSFPEDSAKPTAARLAMLRRNIHPDISLMRSDK